MAIMHGLHGSSPCRYKNLDKLIHYVNEEGRINAFYSTPADYVDAKNAYGDEWPLKTDDFFPYADNPTSYWTGTVQTITSSLNSSFVHGPLVNCSLDLSVSARQDTSDRFCTLRLSCPGGVRLDTRQVWIER